MKEIIYQGGGLVKRGDFQEKDVNSIKYLIENDLSHSFRQGIKAAMLQY